VRAQHDERPVDGPQECETASRERARHRQPVTRASRSGCCMAGGVSERTRRGKATRRYAAPQTSSSARRFSKMARVAGDWLSV
jgi:hypothetical protein